MSEEIKKQIEGLSAQIEEKVQKASEEKSKTIRDGVKAELQKDLDNLNQTIKKLSEHNDSLDVQMQKMAKEGNAVLANKSFADVLREKLSVDFIEKYHTNKQASFIIDDMTAKAVGTMTTGASYTGEVIPADTKQIIPLMDRRTHIRSLLPQGTTGVDTVRLPKETGGEGAIDVTTEGSAKNQIDFDIATTDYPVRKITGLVRASDEILDDTAGLQSFLTNRLTNKLRNKEDQQLLFGTGSAGQLTGLTVNAASFSALDPADTDATYIDLVIQAAAQLETAEYMPNGIILNPKDYAVLVRSKDGNGAYVKDAYWDNNVGAINIFGVNVFKNTAMTQGYYLLGDWSNGAQIFDRLGLRIDFSSEDGDNFSNNLVTIRIEERLALGIYYNEAYLYGQLSTDLAKLVAGS